MSQILRALCCLLLPLAIAGCAAEQPANARAESPISWGDASDGLQIGIAAETVAVPPNQPQPPSAGFAGVKVYVRNMGQNPVQLIDPVTAIADAGDTDLVSILSGSASIPVVRIMLTQPQRVISLIPSQMVWFSVDASAFVSNQVQGSLTLAAEYVNTHSDVIVAPPDGSRPPQTVHIWTGQIRSGDLQVNP
jgi:hypothetical protein